MDQKIILLNWLLSRSATRARNHTPPIHGAPELLDILAARKTQGIAIEFVKSDDDDDDTLRISQGTGKSYTRIYDIHVDETKEFRYVCFLIKHVDVTGHSFSVEDIKEYIGREISGSDDEHSVTSVHLMIRTPIDESQFDIGRYRCVLDAVSPLSRSHIEHFLCRQLRRYSDGLEWKFSVTEQTGRRKSPTTREFRYTPKLELNAEVGRSFEAGAPGAKELSYMVFTKRSEIQTIGRGALVDHDEFLANVEYKILASHGPVDSAEKLSWVAKIRNHFTGNGFDFKLYYRHINGAQMGGEVHQAVSGAADLLMCPKEFVTLASPVRSSESKVNSSLATVMKEILDRDEIWGRSG